jgi:hypothetical protein
MCGAGAGGGGHPQVLSHDLPPPFTTHDVHLLGGFGRTGVHHGVHATPPSFPRHRQHSYSVLLLSLQGAAGRHSCGIARVLA